MSTRAGRKSPNKVSTVMLALAALPSLSMAAEQQHEVSAEATLPIQPSVTMVGRF